MHRLFAAIRPPEMIRTRLTSIMDGIAGARWQDDAQLHLTLRFIGEVDRHAAEDVAMALSSVRAAPFDIALRGIGAFEDRGRPTSLWVGVGPHEQLARLHRKIDQACVRAGLQPEKRAYLPHITIARLRRDSGPIDALIGAQGGLSSEVFRIDSFALYESHLGSDGARYQIIETYPFG